VSISAHSSISIGTGSDFAAALLILREFMHHMKFLATTWRTGLAAAIALVPDEATWVFALTTADILDQAMRVSARN